MVNAHLGLLLEYLYPSVPAFPPHLAQYVVRDDGDGVAYLAQWDAKTLGPPPTLDEFDQAEATPAYQAWLRLRQNHAAAKVKDAKDSLDVGTPNEAAREKLILALMAKVNALEEKNGLPVTDFAAEAKDALDAVIVGVR